MSAIERAEKLVNGYFAIGQQSISGNWSNCFFTEQGFARVGSIIGYGLALHEAGKTEFAEQFLAQFFRQLDSLNESQRAHEFFDQTDSLQQSHGYNKFAPVRKVVVSDDGTRHGLSFAVFRLMPQDKFNAEFERFRWRYCANALRNVPFEDRKQLRREMLDSRRWEWCKSAEKAFRESLRCDDRLTHKHDHEAYRYAFNGALLYHGPRENSLSVSLSSSLFSIHT